MDASAKESQENHQAKSCEEKEVGAAAKASAAKQAHGAVHQENVPEIVIGELSREPGRHWVGVSFQEMSAQALAQAIECAGEAIRAAGGSVSMEAFTMYSPTAFTVEYYMPHPPPPAGETATAEIPGTQPRRNYRAATFLDALRNRLLHRDIVAEAAREGSEEDLLLALSDLSEAAKRFMRARFVAQLEMGWKDFLTGLAGLRSLKRVF